MKQDERVGAVATELGKLSQRLLAHAFTEVDGEGPLGIPQLEDIAARSFPAEWQSDRVTALELVLRRGGSCLDGSFGVISRELAVLHLFNLDGAPDFPEVKKLSAAHIDGDKERTERRYGYLRRKLIERAQIYASEPTVRRELAALRRDLARVLTDPEFPSADAPMESTTPGRVFVVKSMLADEFIPRPEYEQAIRQLRDAGEPHVWLWGEAGTGKTRLARAASRDRVGERAVPVLTASSTKRRLHDQITDLVVKSGISPTVVNSANRLALFLDQLNKGRLPPTIVFDDIPPGSDLVTTLTSARGSFIILTSIERPSPDYTGSSIKVLDMTPTESEQMLRSRLIRVLDADLHLLNTALAGRPLAIERTCSYLRETGMSVMDYCTAIIRHAAHTWTPPAACMAGR